MKKNYLLIVLCLLLLFLNANNSNAFLKNEVKIAEDLIQKAQELRDIGLNDEANEKIKEAETKLKEALLKNTNNMEALFALAKLNYCQGNVGEAENRFFIVYNKRPGLGNKIYDFYMDESKKNKQTGRFNESVSLIVKACDYNPEKKTKIAEEFFRTGSKFLFDNNFLPALMYYRNASRLDSAYNAPNFMALLEASKSHKNPRVQLYLLRTAIEFSTDKDLPEITKVAESIAIKIKENKIKKASIQDELNRIPGRTRSDVEKIAFPPDFKIYPPGTYTFSLKAGEMTDHWIMFPYGRKGGNHYSLSSTDFKYQILYDDGEKYDCWKIKSFPKKLRAKFKIIAVTNQPKLEMVVK